MDTTLNKVNTLPGAWTRFSAALNDALGVRGESMTWRIGQPQISGTMTLVPIFGKQHSEFAVPTKAIRLHKVHTYGDVELACPKEAGGLAIVPLHMGFVQHGAQNHALCGSALIEPGKTFRFKDARCVQAAQGGLLEGREQWFFVLPLALRATALEQIGQTGYSNLWKAIEELNISFGLPRQGHLEHLLTKQRSTLTQFRSRFECLEAQTGALFFIGDRLAGIELAPNSAYFQDIWMPLTAFAYGIAAYGMERTKENTLYGMGQPFAGVTNLDDIVAALHESRAERADALANVISTAAVGFSQATVKAVSRSSETATVLKTVKLSGFTGQFVQREGEVVYASLFRLR